jgi:hypothetical protein
MIRVLLVDPNGERTYIHCDPVRLENHSIPALELEGDCPVRAAAEIGRDLAKGHVSGWVGNFRWYRQAGHRPANHQLQ